MLTALFGMMHALISIIFLMVDNMEVLEIFPSQQ